MPPRIQVRSHSLAFRPRVQRPFTQQLWQSRRTYADEGKQSEQGLHPNPNVQAHTDPAAQSQQAVNEKEDDPRAGALPHVSEEAAAMAKSMGTQPPELEKGTPVAEALKNEPESHKNLPKVMQDALKNQKRSYSTSARRLQPDLQTTSAASSSSADGAVLSLRQIESQRHEINEATALAIADGRLPDPIEARKAAELRSRQPFKFDAPPLPLPSGSHLRKDRYDDIVEQITCLLMRDGKKSQARKHMSDILAHLRTAPSPRASPSRPLLATAPPMHHLPLNPALYLTLAIDSIAPLIRIRSLKGAAGGGMSLQIPQPLNLRQRRRTAIMWLVEAASKKKGGTSGFAKRLAEEVVAVVEGRSSAWEKRNAVHRLAVGGRANLQHPAVLGLRR